jgi:hypothetical protein
MVIDGVMLLWFILTALSVLFVAIDIRTTPEHPVMKWAFVLFTAYSGPLGAFLYVLGCREPLPGLHEQYVAARWRQALGSTMHCVAGDGIGILVGAVIGALIALPMLADFALEYVLGFTFGWTIFQALFMGQMFGSYGRALKGTFTSELLSMNCLMGGMLPVSVLAFAGNAAAHDPSEPLFWFRKLVARGAPPQTRHGHGAARRRSGKTDARHGQEDGYGREKRLGPARPLPASLGHGHRVVRRVGHRRGGRNHLRRSDLGTAHARRVRAAIQRD